MKAIFTIFVVIVAIVDALLVYSAGRLNKEREGGKDDYERRVTDDTSLASEDD